MYFLIDFEVVILILVHDLQRALIFIGSLLPFFVSASEVESAVPFKALKDFGQEEMTRLSACSVLYGDLGYEGLALSLDLLAYSAAQINEALTIEDKESMVRVIAMRKEDEMKENYVIHRMAKNPSNSVVENLLIRSGCIKLLDESNKFIQKILR